MTTPTSALVQRLGSLGLKESFKMANVRGLLIGSLAVGGVLALFSEVAVHVRPNKSSRFEEAFIYTTIIEEEEEEIY